MVTHDIERMFPNGPQMDKATGRWDDPHYLYAHASRSAEVVGFWMHAQADAPGFSLSEVQRLITLHEFGGVGGADLVQAADSLSFLETLQDVVRKWVTHGECDVEQARARAPLHGRPDPDPVGPAGGRAAAGAGARLAGRPVAGAAVLTSPRHRIASA